MNTPQTGVFHEGTSHHIFLEFSFRRTPPSLPGGDLAAAPVDGGTQVIAFGARLVDGLIHLTRPLAMGDFSAVHGLDGFTAPRTQQDMLIWLHGAARDELFARALHWRDALADIAEVAIENHGFRFRDSRDLTGFVDGTANPKGDARMEAALIGDGEHAGGSFVLAQRWLHDLAKFNALPVADQERVFGRTKPASVELTGDAMPPDSHVSRTDLSDIEIYRRSSPVGGILDPGLYFLAFSADLGRFRTLLESMFGLAGDGRRDRMLDYTRAVTGSFFYAPPAAALAHAFAA